MHLERVHVAVEEVRARGERADLVRDGLRPGDERSGEQRVGRRRVGEDRHVVRDARVQAVNFVASDSGLRVLAEELGLKGRSNLVSQILGSSVDRTSSKPASGKIQLQSNADIGANVASGSYPAEAMIVIPCSAGTLARIANGIASSLIERAADVCLKQKLPLVLCVRETPLNKIHIRNMYRAADAGATIFPLIPAYYYRPANLDALAREFAYRVLSYVGLPQPDAFRWKA